MLARSTGGVRGRTQFVGKGPNGLGRKGSRTSECVQARRHFRRRARDSMPADAHHLARAPPVLAREQLLVADFPVRDVVGRGVAVLRPQLGPIAGVGRVGRGVWAERRSHVGHEIGRFLGRAGGKVDNDIAYGPGLVQQLPELVGAHR